MNRYFFDKNARVVFDCEAKNERDAKDFFLDIIKKITETMNMDIGLESYSPDRCIEPEEDEDG